MEDLSNENVIHVKKGNCEYLQFRRLLDYGVNHAYGLIPGNYKTMGKNVGKSEFDNAINHYKILCNSLDIDFRNIVKPLQKHTGNVKSVNIHLNKGPIIESEEFEDTDGLITNRNNVILATTNADCILLLFYDPIKRVIANIHSGWRGTFQKISVNAVNKMILDYGCNPQDIICCICPSIRKCHFEVEDDVKNMCVENFEYTGKLDEIIENAGMREGKNKWRIDTVLINRIILTDIGLKNENIIDCGICSVCNSDMVHSYRVEKEGYGLCTAVISLD